MKQQSVQHWVDGLQSRGQYTFTQEQARSSAKVSAAALQRALHRLRAKGRIARMRNGFFVIVPLEYSSAGALPASWFVDSLMKSVGRSYYVALLTAAGLHGASHQQPHEFQVMTTAPMRPIVLGRVRLVFFTNGQLDAMPTVRTKTPTGSMIVSTPETTAIDLVRYYKSAGYLGNVATVLRELVPALNAKNLLQVARRMGNVSDVRRLGYLLDHIGAKSLTKPLKKWVSTQTAYPVLLRADQPEAGIEPDARWGVIANELIEVET
jgi:predicted transcriptional regulator of viral defense system